MLAAAGNEPQTIAAAVGLALQDLMARYGAEMEQKRAEALVVLRSKMMKDAMQDGPAGAAARRAAYRQLQTASIFPSLTPPAGSPDVAEDKSDYPGLVLVNLHQMAQALRVSLPTMRQLIQRYPDFPIVSRGTNGLAWKFEPTEVIAFVRAKRAAEAEANAARDELLAQISLPLEEAVPPEERGLTPAERVANARAMKIEDEVARERGFLVLMTDVRMTLTPIWAEMSSFLQALPSAVGRPYNLPDAVIRDLRNRISTKQRELHAKIAHMLDGSAEQLGEGDGPGAFH